MGEGLVRASHIVVCAQDILAMSAPLGVTGMGCSDRAAPTGDRFAIALGCAAINKFVILLNKTKA